MSKKAIAIMMIALFAVASLSYYVGGIASRRILQETSQKLSGEQRRADMASNRVNELLAELDALRESREKVIRDAKQNAIIKVDSISSDHNAVAELWNDHLRKFRDNMGKSWDNAAK